MRGACWLLLLASAIAQENNPVAIKQPIPYSHKQHLALGLKCGDCHAAPDPGDRMTLPPASKCMTCHISVAAEKSSIQSLAAFARSKQPIPWKRVYAVAAGVYWSHRTHQAAGLSCQDCHGDVARMETITRVKDITSMGGCMGCHRERKAGLGCELCHEGK